MTNKPMLIVERELLATAMKADASMGASAIELVNGWAAMEELRALLDKEVDFLTPDCPDCACVQDGQCLCIPSKPAAQHHGDPVAWQYRVSAGPATGWSLWHDGKGEEFKNSYQVETRPLYAEQPAPVEHTMRSVMDAAQQARGFPVLTSNQCHALAEALNGVKP